MSNGTGIEWTNETWNAMRGCTRVSEGCRNCYAELVANRFCKEGQPYEGLIKQTSKGPRWNGNIMWVPEKLVEPLRWTKPRRIFVNSMSDMFHEGLSFERIASVFGVMATSQRHTFQILTKRPKRMLAFFEWLERREKGPVCAAVEEALTEISSVEDLSPGKRNKHGRVLQQMLDDVSNIAWPLPNVWLGVSVEDQVTADERIPLLVETPARVRWISAEPLLGPVNLPLVEDLDWVVVGGESGPKARSMEIGWARALRDQCKRYDVAFFFKQWGNIDEHGVKRSSKKAAGRLLDGREWSEYPDVIQLDEAA